MNAWIFLFLCSSEVVTLIMLREFHIGDSEVETMTMSKGSQMKFWNKMRLRPWLCREGLKLNFEKNEVETMTTSRRSQIKWMHECMQYFSFFSILEMHEWDAWVHWEHMNIYMESYERIMIYENVCMECIVSIFCLLN